MKEDSGFPTGPVGENPNNFAGSLEVNPSEVGNPAVLRRLNAIVGGIADHEYIVAEHAIERLKNNLGKIGLAFAGLSDKGWSSQQFKDTVSNPWYWGNIFTGLDTPKFIEDYKQTLLDVESSDPRKKKLENIWT